MKYLLLIFILSTTIASTQNVDTLETDHYKPLLDSFPFQKYKASKNFKGKLAKLDLKPFIGLENLQYKKAEFANYISNQYYDSKQPNFAGHYIIVSWSCGSPCQTNAIIDANTGKRITSFSTTLGVDFRNDSYLLILNPPLNGKNYQQDYRAIFGEPEINIFKNGKLIALTKR